MLIKVSENDIIWILDNIHILDEENELVCEKVERILFFVERGTISFMENNGEIVAKIDCSIAPILARDQLMDDIMHQLVIAMNAMNS